MQTDSIEGERDPSTICDLFSNKYRKIFNRCRNNMSKSKLNEKQKTRILLRFSLVDVRNAIARLNPTIGPDNIHTNHLKLGSDLFVELIANLFSSFIIHNYIPTVMLKGIITPIIKDKHGDITKMDNYRPIMSSSVFLKTFEYCLLEKIESYVTLNDR